MSLKKSGLGFHEISRLVLQIERTNVNESFPCLRT